MSETQFIRWIPAYPGHLRKGDRVRVVENAFRSPSALKVHSGRVGIVVDVADGDIIVESIDSRKPVLKRARYPYYKLEKAV